MTKKRSLKRAMLMSALSILLCVSMLIGSTFAWFTDNVSTTNNIIKSGNLDVELYYQVEGQNNWIEVTDKTNVFKGSLWEPGHTEVVKLKVVNAGTLALKYQLGVNIASEIGSKNVLGNDFKLSDYIYFGVVEGAQNYTRDQAVDAVKETATQLNTAYSSKIVSLQPKTETNSDNEDIVTMVVYMPTSVGNEANYAKNQAVPTINLGINLYATQVEAEEDSFGNDYDEDVSFPDYANTATELIAALKEGKNVTLSTDINLENVNWEPIASYSGTLDGAGHTIFNLKGENGLFDTLDGATIKNLKLENVDIDATSYYTGAVAGSIAKNPDVVTIIDNVTVSGKIDGYDYYTGGLIGASSAWHATISNCVNNADVTASGQQVGGILGYAKRNTVVDSCVNNGKVTGGLFVGGILGLAAGDDENPDLSVFVKNCKNTGNISETNVNDTWAGGVADIVGFVGREGGKTPSVMTTFYFMDNTVREGQKVYGRIGNVSGGTDYITVYAGDTFPAAGGAAAIMDAVKAMGANESKTFFLTDGEYTGNIDLTVDVLGENKFGDIAFVAVSGANPVITGTVTIGYREQNVGAAMYGAKVTFDGITFDHALAGNHSLSVQDVKSFYMVNCTVIGDGEYGLSSPGSNGTGESKIENCKFVNAGMQLAGKFAQYLVIDECTFEESVINVQGGGPLGPTIQNSTFDITLKDAHHDESFYVIRNSNAGANIKVMNCKINVDSEMTFTGTAGSKGWGVFVNRIASYDITVDDVEVYLTDAALAQPNLVVACCLSTGKINMTNLTLNGVESVTFVSKGLFTDSNGNFYVFNAAGLEALHNWCTDTTNANYNMRKEFWGKTYSLIADINANGYTWTTIETFMDGGNSKGIAFNGNGHTISNMIINGNGMFTGPTHGNNAGDVTVIKDLTLDNVTVTGRTHHNGAVWGEVVNSITLENVNVINSKVSGGCNVGGLVGRNSESHATIKFVDCSVKNTTVEATQVADYAGASAFLGNALHIGTSCSANVIFEGNNVSEGNILTTAEGMQGGGIYTTAEWGANTWENPTVVTTFTNYNSAN